MSDSSLTELSGQVAELTDRIAQLQARLDGYLATQPAVAEEVVLAITAAVTAYLGHSAKVRQVRFSSGQSWTGRGRTIVPRA